MRARVDGGSGRSVSFTEHVPRAAVAPDLEHGLRARLPAGDVPDEILVGADRPVVGADDDVVRAQTRALGRRPGRDVLHERAALRLEPERAVQRRASGP